VLVSRASIPGAKALEDALVRLDGLKPACVLVGVSKKLPKQVEQAFGLQTRRAREDGRVFFISADAQLAVSGLGTDPLPTALLQAVSPLAAAWGGEGQ
jgi:hypothetical protein